MSLSTRYQHKVIHLLTFHWMIMVSIYWFYICFSDFLVLTPDEVKHVQELLNRFPRLKELNKRVCPRHRSTSEFWNIYFTLLKHYLVNQANEVQKRIFSLVLTTLAIPFEYNLREEQESNEPFRRFRNSLSDLIRPSFDEETRRYLNN